MACRSCKLWLLGSFGLLLLAVVLGGLSLALGTWVQAPCGGRPGEGHLPQGAGQVQVGLLRVCYEAAHHRQRICDSLTDHDHPVPVWVRSIQVLVFTGQVCGALITVLSGLHLAAPALTSQPRVGAALSLGATCAGILTLLGVGGNAGTLLRLSRPHAFSALTPEVAAALASNDVTSVTDIMSTPCLGRGHYVGLMSGLTYLCGGLVCGVASLVVSSGRSRVTRSKKVYISEGRDAPVLKRVASRRRSERMASVIPGPFTYCPPPPQSC